jgi:DNA invertase Pin-like site-specific DNA recombinase
MSGAKADRPELLKALAKVQRGDVLVVARLDRLARSLSHLLSVIAELDARGAHFKSLADPIDTTTPQGRFALQVLGAVAELERALIQERTKDGLRAARKRGRIGGNPGLKARDPEAVKRIADSRRQNYFNGLNAASEHWLPIVRQMRPDHRWEDVARVLNSRRGAFHSRPNTPAPPRWSVEKLKRAVKRFVAEGLADPALLGTARRKPASDRLLALVAGIAGANPQLTLEQIGAQLEVMYERTPRGGARWAPSSVKNLLDRARKLGLVTQAN